MSINTKLEELVEESYEKIKEIYSAPHAAKSSLMQTNGKLAINVLNQYKTLKQAESGKEQARAVIAKMICDSKEEVIDFFEANLPEIIITSKQLKK